MDVSPQAKLSALCRKHSGGFEERSRAAEGAVARQG